MAGESILVEVRKECSVPRLLGLGCFEVLQENLETVLTRNEERRDHRMEKPKLMSKTFTLTRRETGLFKQPSYRVCKDGKFYYFSSVSGITSFIAEFIKLRSEDDLVTITVETTKLKEEHPRSLNGGYSCGAGI